MTNLSRNLSRALHSRCHIALVRWAGIARGMSTAKQDFKEHTLGHLVQFHHRSLEKRILRLRMVCRSDYIMCYPKFWQRYLTEKRSGVYTRFSFAESFKDERLNRDEQGCKSWAVGPSWHLGWTRNGWTGETRSIPISLNKMWNKWEVIRQKLSQLNWVISTVGV